MRRFYESSRLFAYLAIFRYCAIVQFAKLPLAFKRDGNSTELIVRIRWSVLVLFLAIIQLIATLGGLVAGVVLDFIWSIIVPAILFSFNVVGYPTMAIFSAHMAWKDHEPRNRVSLDLFHFKGIPLFMADRCCIFSAEYSTHFDEVFRVFRIISSTDSSVFIARTDRVVFIYNTSRFAKAEKDSTAGKESHTIHLPIPNRSDIRERSWLQYSVRVCQEQENSVHKGLINADTYNKMTRAIKDCYNVLDSGIHFSIMNAVKSVLIPLVPALVISMSFKITKWGFLQWIGENEIEIFFGVSGSLALFRVIRHDAPIYYERTNWVPERVEQVARVATIRQNDASPASTAWHQGETFGSIDCQIKNGMEALMLAFILVYEKEDGKLTGVCIDEFVDFEEAEEETGDSASVDSMKRKRTMLVKWRGEKKNEEEINKAVKEYNDQRYKPIPANVWLGRPLLQKEGANLQTSPAGKIAHAKH